MENKQPTYNNLSKKEYNILTEIKNVKSIIIRIAYKGENVVIIYWEEHNKEALH